MSQSPFKKSVVLLLVLLLPLLIFLPLVAHTQGNTIAYALYNSSNQNLTNFAMDPATDPPQSRNVWGIFSRGDDVPDFIDDTVANPPDPEGGIIRSSDEDTFFGVQDLQTQFNPSGTGTVTWTFDISSATMPSLTLSVDVGAMGDWVSNNDFGHFTFDYRIDGGAWQTAISTTTEVGASQTYTFEDGSSVQLDNPLAIDGILLNNYFQTFSTAIGNGDELQLRFNAMSEGDLEVFAFRNILITAEPYASYLPVIRMD
jgi:hypothetical protein